MNKAFGRDTTYVSTIGLSQIAGAQMLHVFGPRKWINAGQAGPLGWTAPAALGVVRGKPDETVVALSGDYDFQFMIEELAVGAQFNLPYIHVVVNNSYLGLIRQSQRGFNMEQNVSLAFENINSPGDQRLRRGPPQGGRGPGLQGHPRGGPQRPGRRVRQGQGPDGRVPGSRGGGSDPGKDHQHLHGRGNQRRQRVRGTGRDRADAPTAILALQA